MINLRVMMRNRLSPGSFDARLGQWACNLGGVLIIPLALRALSRHGAGRWDVIVGVGVAGLVGLLSGMLGLICRHSPRVLESVSARGRWPEFVAYFCCMGMMIGGVYSLSGLGLNPVQLTLGLLVTSALSLGVLVFGMLTTVVRGSGPGD